MKKWLIRLVGLVCTLLLVELLNANKENVIIGLVSLIYLDMAKEDF
ncbi:hypothetical protein [uncultured Anaerococcus sp.]|nr:hypothetical protein [uncultured Anaerococcus sp.]